jgi:hypothetical protein
MYFLLQIFQEKQYAPNFLNGQYHEITSVKKPVFFLFEPLGFQKFLMAHIGVHRQLFSRCFHAQKSPLRAF